METIWLTIFAALIALSSACAMSLRNAHIADLQQHPGRYEDRTVTVDGIVTDSWGVPLVPFKFYRIDHGRASDLRKSLRKVLRACRARANTCA